MFGIDWGTIMALGGIFLGTGGIAALIRAHSQNRVDERTQLTVEQQAFRQSMAEDRAAIYTRLNESEKRNDVLEAELRTQGKQIASLETTKEYQAKEIAELRKQNTAQAEQLTAQATRLAAVTEEKVLLNQRVITAEAKASFLEKENNVLRYEVARLQGELPPRVEVS